jgi:hypothetical protein
MQHMNNNGSTKVEQILMMALLDDYNLLNNKLSELSEDQLWSLIDMEIAGKKRKSFVERLHQRVSKLATARERAELMEKCNG